MALRRSVVLVASDLPEANCENRRAVPRVISASTGHRDIVYCNLQFAACKLKKTLPSGKLPWRLALTLRSVSLVPHVIHYLLALLFRVHLCILRVVY